jgi:hypothetical protein
MPFDLLKKELEESFAIVSVVQNTKDSVKIMAKLSQATSSQHWAFWRIMKRHIPDSCVLSGSFIKGYLKVIVKSK